ncbi:hypothetical protein J3E69DRAFT_339360 [Trichoderma sp. SZMC 28015]
MMMMMAMIELIVILFDSLISRGYAALFVLDQPDVFALSLSVSIAYALGPSVLLLLRNARNEPHIRSVSHPPPALTSHYQ